MSKKINVSSLVWRIEQIKYWAKDLKDTKFARDFGYDAVIKHADEAIKMLLPDEIEITEDNET